MSTANNQNANDASSKSHEKINIEARDFNTVSPPPKKNKKTRINLTALFIKILLIILISLFLGSLASFVAIEFLSGTNLFGLKVAGGIENNLILIVFTATFCISALLLNFAYTTPRQIVSDPKPRAAPPSQIESSPLNGNKLKGNKREIRKHLSSVMAGSEDFIIEEPKAPEQAQLLKEEGPSQSADLADELAGQLEEPSSDAEIKRTIFTEFFVALSSALSNLPENMNSYDKFGTNLFLAGASEILSNEHGLDEPSRKKILHDSIQSMGGKKSHAAVFIEKYEQYLLQDPCYLQMYQSGGNAMKAYLHNPKSSLKSLKLAIENWNLPKSALSENVSITILHSSFLPDTGTAQQLSGANAKKILAAHDQIVRTALSRKKGREIKHTGNGMMALFYEAFNGVDAAIQMQRDALTHNQQNPNMPLQLKIGIDTGEPIENKENAFSTVSELSSQIGNNAEAGEIFVSENTRGICKGRGQNFNSRGNHEIKGYHGLMPLYEVLWRT